MANSVAGDASTIVDDGSVFDRLYMKSTTSSKTTKTSGPMEGEHFFKREGSTRMRSSGPTKSSQYSTTKKLKKRPSTRKVTSGVENANGLNQFDRLYRSSTASSRTAKTSGPMKKEHFFKREGSTRMRSTDPKKTSKDSTNSSNDQPSTRRMPRVNENEKFDNPFDRLFKSSTASSRTAKTSGPMKKEHFFKREGSSRMSISRTFKATPSSTKSLRKRPSTKKNTSSTENENVFNRLYERGTTSSSVKRQKTLSKDDSSKSAAERKPLQPKNTNITA